MAKTIENLEMFIEGDPEAASPSGAMATYSVVDGEARDDNKSYNIASPDFTKTANQFWSDAVTAIKSAEGIS